MNCSKCDAPFPVGATYAIAKPLCDLCAFESNRVRFCSKHGKKMSVAWEPSEEFPTCPVCAHEFDHANDGKPASAGDSHRNG